MGIIAFILVSSTFQSLSMLIISATDIPKSSNANFHPMDPMEYTILASFGFFLQLSAGF
jgi:hypothetical protein